MARFNYSAQKFDENGNKIPKGAGMLKKYRADNPNLMIFDSKSEYELYIKLKEDERRGLIRNLRYKEKFLLVDKCTWYNNIKQKNENIRELYYITDFVFEREGKKVVVDCKGWRQVKDKKTGKLKWTVYYDELYKLKKKILLSRYGMDFVFEEM